MTDRSQRSSGKVCLSKRTEKICLQAFNKEYTEGLAALTGGEAKRLPLLIDEETYLALMGRLGTVKSLIRKPDLG